MMLNVPLPALDDPEGDRVPEDYPPVVDAHVHVFPDAVFKAVWKWFDEYGWPVRYQINSEKLLGFLFDRGVSHVVALQYAHKPGIATDLNRFMQTLCQLFPEKVTGLATVFPGEPGAADVLAEAFQGGLSGAKLHSHVQCFDMNDPAMDPIYDICASYEKPLVMHVGREPKSPAYACDPYLICKAEKLDVVLRNFPTLKVCVPHLGADEFQAYRFLIEKYDNLWLDTAMAITDYLPGKNSVSLPEMRIERIMYGSDFPNIPYAWDRELNELADLVPDRTDLARILGRNARELYSLNP